MGTTLLKFDGLLANSQFLKDFTCPNCQQPITEQAIQAKNYVLGVSDYANEISKELLFSSKLSQGQPFYSLIFWLKGVEHEECPEGEEVKHE